MSTSQQIIRDTVQKWASRGYIEPHVVRAVADDIWGEAIAPFPELERITENTRAVDLGMQCYMQGHEERLARIKQIAQEALDWADGATLDPAWVMRIVEGNE